MVSAATSQHRITKEEKSKIVRQDCKESEVFRVRKLRWQGHLAMPLKLGNHHFAVVGSLGETTNASVGVCVV